MRNLFKHLLIFCALTAVASAGTSTIPAGSSAAAIQSIVNTAAATAGNVVSFPAGTFNLASGLTVPCQNGLVVTGAPATFIPGPGVSPTTILNATFTGGNLLTLKGSSTYTSPGAGCTIENLGIANQNVYIIPQLSGLLFQNNKIYNIVGSVKGSGNTTSWAGIYVDNGTTQDIANSIFQNNTFGPSCSDVDASTSTDYNGTCGGLVIHGSNVNVSFLSNNVNGQIEELFHTLAQGTGGQVSTNLLIQNNDCGGVHRICIETQQGSVKNQIIRWNSLHDYFNPTPFSFGISNACCFAPNSTAPGTVTTGNLIIANTPCTASYCYGYGIEAWGNQAQFTNNVIQTNAAAKLANAIMLGGATGATSTALMATGNIVQGYSPAVGCENGGSLPNCTFVTGTVNTSGNTSIGTAASIVSQAPSISLSGDLVTAIDAALNTSIYYTVDGSTPAPGQGSTLLYSGPVTLPSGATIKAVGMWGAGANPYSYPSGFGYVPSAVVQATYTAVVVVPPPPPPPVATPVPCTSLLLNGTLTITCGPNL